MVAKEKEILVRTLHIWVKVAYKACIWPYFQGTNVFNFPMCIHDTVITDMLSIENKNEGDAGFSLTLKNARLGPFLTLMSPKPSA